MSSHAKVQIRRRFSGIFGGISGGLGTFGALHNVCHYTCQIVVAGLGIAGITLTGLPLAFLEDPKLIVLFGSMGTVSLGVSMTLHVKAKRWSFQTYNLKEAITLETGGGTSVRSAQISISDWGHMGHHVRGRITFPVQVGGTVLLERSVLRLKIRGIGGVEKRVLEWRVEKGGR